MERALNQGIPANPLVESNSIPIEDLAEMTRKEGQRTKSLYRAHRWFARRLGTPFRALLISSLLPENRSSEFWDFYKSDAPLADGLTVLDPYMGGGTTLIEASRMGATVIGTDIDPVPATITRFHLESSKVENLSDSLERLKTDVGDEIRDYHTTTDSDGNEREVLYHFWVQVTECHSCEKRLELHPHFKLAYDTTEGVQWAFCRHCHQIQELDINRKVLVCDDCNKRTTIEAGTLRNGTVFCLNCRSEESLAANSDRRDGPPNWEVFAQQYLERYGSGPRSVNRQYKRASLEDVDLYSDAANRLESVASLGDINIPQRCIPTEHRTDSRPVLHGFRKYADLFNKRQLLHLHLLANRLKSQGNTPKQRALQIAFSEHLTTNNMLVGYAFGYERTSPLFSYHSFRHITRPVEVNPWLHRIGRGTFPNAVLKLEKAIEGSKNPKDLLPSGEKRTSNASVGVKEEISHDLDEAPSRSVVAATPAQELSRLPDSSVDIVFTDPPYGDNISYSELSDFYLAWHQVLGIAPGVYQNPDISAPLEGNLAASDRTKSSLSEYQKGLSEIFSISNDALQQNGVMMFTFHHTDPGTWEALAKALNSSGLSITNVFPLRGEGQNGLHNHSGTIKWDSVFVCRKQNWDSNFLGDQDDCSGIKWAKSNMRDWTERFREKEIEFSHADQLSLFRSFITASYVNNDDGCINIHEAMRHEMN